MQFVSFIVLLLQAVATLGAVHGGRREGIQQTPTSTLGAHTTTQALVAEFASAAPQATRPSGTVDHDNRPDKKDKRAVLAAVHQAAEDDYQRKFHDNDDYAKWAKDPNLNRGPAWSKVFRSLLYKHPSEWHCSAARNFALADVLLRQDYARPWSRLG